MVRLGDKNDFLAGVTTLHCYSTLPKPPTYGRKERETKRKGLALRTDRIVVVFFSS